MLNHNVAFKGGTFYRAYNVGRHLAYRGHSVTLLTISENRRWGIEREESEGVELIRIPDLLWGIGRTGWDPWDALNRIFYLSQHAWDIVHAWDCRPVVIIPALCARRRSRKRGCKLVIDWCDWWGRGGTQTERPGRLMKFLYGPIETYFEEAFRVCADGTTVISRALYDRALKLGVNPNTMRILPQGCEANIQSRGDRTEARRRLGLPLFGTTVLCVGTMTRSEATLLFDCLRLLFNRKPDCRFIMIGNHRAQIPSDLKRCGQLIETGFIPDSTLNDYMEACDAILTPLADNLASQARWPSKINPFLAAGRAVVITRVGDLARLLERENAAVVVRSDPATIVNSLIELLDNPALRLHYENQARRVAQTILDWPSIVARLEEFYMRLVNPN
jgi:glycosyltransferase involved in cell wall biosynthesis